MATITCLPSSSLKPNQLSYYDPVTLINIVTGFFMSDKYKQHLTNLAAGMWAQVFEYNER